jgi:hypothetical protein
MGRANASLPDIDDLERRLAEAEEDLETERAASEAGRGSYGARLLSEWAIHRWVVYAYSEQDTTDGHKVACAHSLLGPYPSAFGEWDGTMQQSYGWPDSSGLKDSQQVMTIKELIPA